MKRRQIVIGLLLIATLVAAWFAPDPDKGVVAPSVRPVANVQPEVAKPSATETALAETFEVLAIKPRIGEEEDLQIFSPTQWEKPQPVVKAEPPPEPQAPPLPFKFLGRYAENGVSGYFLMHNEHNLIVREGDTIDDLYKFEGEKEGTLHFLYLPLKKQQTLEIGTMK